MTKPHCRPLDVKETSENGYKACATDSCCVSDHVLTHGAFFSGDTRLPGGRHGNRLADPAERCERAGCLTEIYSLNPLKPPALTLVLVRIYDSANRRCASVSDRRYVKLHLWLTAECFLGRVESHQGSHVEGSL